VNRRKPRVQTPVVSSCPEPAPVDDFILLFLPPCGSHLTPLTTGSLESGLLVSPLLGGPTRHRPFAPTLHLHQRKSSRNQHLQYSAKSQSTPRCQSLITARSNHPPVLGRSSPHPRTVRLVTDRPPRHGPSGTLVRTVCELRAIKIYRQNGSNEKHTRTREELLAESHLADRPPGARGPSAWSADSSPNPTS
jgi:hypothetical protein